MIERWEIREYAPIFAFCILAGIIEIITVIVTMKG